MLSVRMQERGLVVMPHLTTYRYFKEISMTVFHSRIELGKKYKDKRVGFEGFANVICFQQHGCVEIQLEFEKDGKKELVMVNELRLVAPHGGSDADLSAEDHTYESDLVLDGMYEDTQTGIAGHVAVVEFHEFMATRGILKTVGTDTKGLKAIKYHSIDDFLLKDLATAVVAEDHSGKKSPITREVPGPEPIR